MGLLSEHFIINKVDKKLVINAVPAYMDSIALNMISNAIKYRSNERSSYLKINLVEDDSNITLLFDSNRSLVKRIGSEIKRQKSSKK